MAILRSLAIVLALICATTPLAAKAKSGSGGHHGGGGTPPGIVAINLSCNPSCTVASGASTGTVIGTITVTMVTGSYAGSTPTLVSSGGSCSGGDTTHFQIVGSGSPWSLETNGTATAGTVCVQATQVGASGSPFTQTEVVTFVPIISGVGLSNGTAFITPASSGTTIDTLTATCSVGSCTGATFALATTGSCSGATANSSFAISGSNLKIGGTTVNAGSYPIGIAVTLAGASNSGMCYPSTLVGSGSTANQEFVGPFSTWKDVTTAPCSADKTGVADATVAIQTCFQLLGSSVYDVYFPAGTYKISDVATTATAGSGSSTITVASATGLAIGMLAWDNSGSFIPLGTTISNISGTTVTLTKPTVGVLSSTPLKFSLAVHTPVNGLNIICHDPSDTSFVWAGSNQGIMLYLNGFSYSNISRCTFDGQGVAGIAVDQGWDNDGTHGSFDTGNQYADVVLKNVADGGNSNLGALFRCGNLGYGCAETTIIRSTLSGASKYGISMRNFNALDMWVWYSKLLSNGIGVSNEAGAGDFKVYESLFANNSIYDTSHENGGVFSLRFNYSGPFGMLGPSNAFYKVASNPGTLQGNTVLDSTTIAAVAGCEVGPLTVLDNVFRSKVGSTVGPVVDGGTNTMNGFACDLFSMGNTFTVTSPERAGGRWHTIDDTIVSRGSVNPIPPTLPSTPPNNSRTIFEVAPGATTAQIQTAITNAVAAGSKAVVHIQAGTYNITSTLTVPISDIQIIGDSAFHSTLAASGANPVLKLLGPGNKATLQEFAVNGSGNSADGIEIDGADQSGAQVILDQVQSLNSGTRAFWSDTLDYTVIQWTGGGVIPNIGTTGAEVVGGTLAASGSWQGGALNIFGQGTSGPGGSSPPTTTYKVSNGGHLLVEDVFYDLDGGASNLASATGQYSTLTLSGITLNSNQSGSIAINNFQGKSVAQATIITPGGTMTLTGTGSGAQNLGLTMLGSIAAYYLDTTSPADTMEYLDGQTTFSPPVGSCCGQVAEIGSADPTFLRSVLTQLRTAQPFLPTTSASGVTNVQLRRVFVHDAVNGIHVKN